MEIIELKSRYGDNHILEKIEDNIYKIVTSDGYMRAGLSVNPNEYEFLDPSGGPFLCVGGYLPVVNKKIKSLKFEKDKGYLITVE